MTDGDTKSNHGMVFDMFCQLGLYLFASMLDLRVTKYFYLVTLVLGWRIRFVGYKIFSYCDSDK